jgi:molecular chaperone HscB
LLQRQIVVGGKSTGVRLNCKSCTSSSTSAENNSSKRVNAYNLFSIPLSFKIDEELLRTKYHEHMKNLHPDKQNSVRDSNHIDDTDDKAVAAITNSYNILKRPHLRAMHLLKIMNYKPTDQPGNLGDDIDEHSDYLTDPSQDFLIEVMDLQELIHDLKTDEELKPYFDENLQRINDTCEQLQNAFETSNIQEFQNLVSKLKYWTRIDETLRNKMTSLE